MSRDPEKAHINHAHVNANKSMTSNDDVAMSGDHLDQPTLPTGEIIDGKNALQSFEAIAHTPIDSLAPPNPLERPSVPKMVAPPTIPTGAVIDGKNTLQSFEAIGHTPSVSPALPNVLEHLHVPPPITSPTIPTGEVIDGKNTLQSFHVIVPTPTNQLLPTDLSINLFAESETRTTESIEAIPNILDAELAPDLVPSLNVFAVEEDDFHVPLVPWYKQACIFSMLVVFAVCIAVGLGLYFGLRDGSSSANFPTPAPTFSPTLLYPNDTMNSDSAIKATVVAAYVNTITLSNQTISFNDTSPEGMALSWLISDDMNLNISSLASLEDLSSMAIGFSIRQRFPLLVMYFQQTETHKWDNTDGWLVDPNECNWYGITCQVMFDPGSQTYQNATTQIRLNGTSSYVGVIPFDIGLLSHLQHFEIKDTTDLIYVRKRRGMQVATPFDLKTSALVGPLPDSIGQWTALTYFDVSRNELTGALPDSISQWNDMIFLMLAIIDSTEHYLIPLAIGQCCPILTLILIVLVVLYLKPLVNGNH
jgi:hypothetical protein